MNRITGKYVRQPGGYRAFHPHSLPPVPPVAIDDEMQALLSAADRALGRLDGSIEALPDSNLFVFMYVRKEAVLSSQIEGTQASINDVLAAESKIPRAGNPEDAAEVVNYVAALNLGLERLPDLPISGRLMREIHSRLMQGVRGQNATPGEFRTSQNWIGPMGSILAEAIFVPPPPSELPPLIADLERFVHAEDRIPLLIKIGMVHYQFETIHPFLDGNGRIGRLLITFLLCEREILGKPVLYLSHYFKRYRQRYYDLLQAARDTGDLEAWLKFFLMGVTEVANEASETARRIVEMREDHRMRIVDSLGRGAGNGLRLLESLYQRPIFNVADVARLLSLTGAAANTLTQRFVELGLAREITGYSRNRLFLYDPYVALFTGD